MAPQECTTRSLTTPSVNSYCSHGHNMNHSCRRCLARTLTQWGYDAETYDREAVRERGKRRSREHRQQWGVKGDPDAAHRNRRKNYGITSMEYDAKLHAQNHCCALCGLAESRRYKGTLISLAVDHDHTTGTVRDLLCSRCNIALGHLESCSSAWLQMAIAYLCRHGVVAWHTHPSLATVLVCATALQHVSQTSLHTLQHALDASRCAILPAPPVVPKRRIRDKEKRQLALVRLL